MSAHRCSSCGHRLVLDDDLWACSNAMCTTGHQPPPVQIDFDELAKWKPHGTKPADDDRDDWRQK